MANYKQVVVADGIYLSFRMIRPDKIIGNNVSSKVRSTPFNSKARGNVAKYYNYGINLKRSRLNDGGRVLFV